MVDTIAKRVREVIADALDIDIEDVIAEATISEDLGADSLDAIDLTMALEDEFGIEISEEDALELRTVQHVVSYVETQLARVRQQRSASTQLSRVRSATGRL
jgi:acyl carrier protein